MLTLKPGETCYAFLGDTNKRTLVIVQSVDEKGQKAMICDKTTKSNEIVMMNTLQKVKKQRKPTCFDKPSDDAYDPKNHPARARLVICPILFQAPGTFGDFNYMLSKEDMTKPQEVLKIFNDNVRQFEMAGLYPQRQQLAGAGNACIRPYEPSGWVIGMPTGPFTSLDQEHLIQFPSDPEALVHTTREIIDEAILRIVLLLIRKPSIRIVYYSRNADHPTRIGVMTFTGMVPINVLDYITTEIGKLPLYRHIKMYSIQ